MMPIFKEYRQMLKSFNVELSDYDKDKLWIDRMIIRGFDKNGGQVRKICRLKVTDDLKYEYKYYDEIPFNCELETYEETYQRMSEQILEKEKESIQVVKDMINKYSEHNIILTTSMGKDSKLSEYILNKVVDKNSYRIIFNNTTMDCAEVYREVKSDKRIEIITPKMSNGKNRSFYDMIQKHGTPPSRFSRWCCSYFKEGAVNQHLKDNDNLLYFLGMRKAESATRSNYKADYTSPSWTNKTWNGCLPILEWGTLEVWLYTIHNNIDINDKYLKGYQRVGCHIVCPYYTKSTWILDKYFYNTAYNRFHKIIEKDFIVGEKWAIVNATISEYHLNWNGGLVRKQPNDDVLNEFMKYKGITDRELALQYFDKKCMDCNKKVYKKNEIAMNLKYFGRKTKQFKCKKCFMKDMNWSKKQWDEQVRSFRSQDCKLF